MTVRRPLVAGLLSLALLVTALVAIRPDIAGAEDALAFAERQRDVRRSHPDAVVVTGRGEVQHRRGDDVPALLDAAADPRDATTFAQGLQLLLAAQGQAIGIAVPAPDRPGASAEPAFAQTPAPTPPPPSDAAGDSSGRGPLIPFVGESVVIDDIDGDGLQDVIRWTRDGDRTSAIEAVRGIDGSLIWRAPLDATGSFGVSLQPLGDVTGDGAADLLTSIQVFDEDSNHSECEAFACTFHDRFTWVVELREGTTGAVVWTRTHEGSNDYEDVFDGVEQRSSGRTINGVVPYQPLQDVTGDGIGDFLVTLTAFEQRSELTVEGSYPGPVTTSDSHSGSATTTLQIVSGTDAAVIADLTEADVDSVLGARPVPDTTGDGVSDVLLTRRGLSSSARTCVTEGTSRTCTEEGRSGGLEVELRDAALQMQWEASYPVQEGVATSPGDLTGDGVRDTVVQAYSQIGEGIIAVLDGADGSEVWTQISTGERYHGGEGVLAVTPLGDGDSLDLLTVRYRPQAPGQPQLEIVRRDGATGAELLVTGHGAPGEGEDDRYVHTFAAGTADADGDGSADIVLVIERFEEDVYTLTTIIESGRTGQVLSSLPQQSGQWRHYQVVGDLDGDGGADAVAFDDHHAGTEGEEDPAPVSTAVRLVDGAVIWQRPSVPNSYVHGAVTAQLDGDAGEDLLVTRERFTDVIHVRQTVAIDGEDGSTLWAAPTPPEVRRIAGSNRILTAVELARATHDTAATVVLARADDFPDALAGGPLATVLDAPLLLTATTGLDSATAEEIVRLGATDAVLLGGTAAIAEQVADDLRALGVGVERLAGDDRYATAAMIADRVAGVIGPLDRVAIAAGGQDGAPDAAGEPTGWTDAILASTYGAATDAPLLLVRADAVPDATVAALQRLAPAKSSMLVGDGVAISAEAEQHVRDLTGKPTERLARDTPAATAEHVASFAIRDGASPRSVWVATSARFPDALAASAAVGASGGVLLLTDGTEAADAALLRFLGRFGLATADITLVGGPTAVPMGTEARIADAVALD